MASAIFRATSLICQWDYFPHDLSPVGAVKYRPFVLIADIAFTENRFPVRRTTKVRPCSP
jgi:hypothetical protein